jgi:hypothetical protein
MKTLMKILFLILLPNKKDTNGRYREMDAIKNYTNAASESTSNVSYTWIFVGVMIGCIVGLVAYLILGRVDTRPVRESFVSMPVKGASGVACGQMSSEAESLYSLFASRSLSVGDEGSSDLRDLKNLLGKMCCMKRDLMSPLQAVTSIKELGAASQFATHMDIQPVADLTASCFSKTIPERDLSIQFEKWRDYGNLMIRRLCTAASMNESEAQNAENLFKSSWADAYSVAQTTCIGGVPTGAFSVGGRDPAPRTPEPVKDLQEYSGPGARY